MRFEVYREALTFFELTARIYGSYFIAERLRASALENSPEKFFSTLETLREKLSLLKLRRQEEESWLAKTEHMQHIHFRAFESSKKMLSATSHGSTATEIAMSDKLMLFFLRDDRGKRSAAGTVASATVFSGRVRQASD